MALEQFSIEIIDTETNTMPLVDELIAMRSPHLIYNGTDDKFANLVTSELHFNMEVSDGSDGKFLHLYTGSEKRYLARLYDTTDELNPVQLWQGYLLPEQFNEPYTNDAFFTAFIFTDGIGQLKGQYLPDSFYTDRKSIASIIANCLLLTGNSLSIEIAPAIVNEVIDPLRLDEIEIDTRCYDDNDKRKDAYSILEAVVESIGCRLFLLYNRWYVIGINRFKDTSIITEVYDTTGVYIGVNTIVREIKISKFQNKASITLLPSYKTVEIDWEINENKSVLRDDIVYQLPPEGTGSIYTYQLKYWLIEFTTIWTAEVTTANMYGVPDYTVDEGDVMQLYNDDSVLPQPNTRKFAEPFYVSLAGYITSGQLTTDYIELEDKVYIEGAYGQNKKMQLTIEFKSWIDDTANVTTVETNFNNGDYDNVYYYAIELNGVVICSNWSTFSNDHLYDYELSFNTSAAGAYIHGRLTINVIPILLDGYLNVKINPPVGTDASLHLHKTVYEKLSLTYVASKNATVTKTRDIVSTVTKTISVFHGDSKSGLTLRNYRIADSVTFAGVTINYPAIEQQLSATNYTYTTEPGVPEFNQWQYDITDEEHFLLKLNYSNFYKKNTSNVFTNIPIFTLEKDDATQKKVTITYPTSTYLDTSDTLYIKYDAYSVLFDDVVYIQDKWRRYENASEQVRYTEALACVYHDAVKEPKFKIEGDLFGVRLPLDILSFSYIEDKNYQLSVIDVNLSEGMTGVVMIDQLHEEVIGYGN